MARELHFRESRETRFMRNLFTTTFVLVFFWSSGGWARPNGFFPLAINNLIKNFTIPSCATGTCDAASEEEIDGSDDLFDEKVAEEDVPSCSGAACRPKKVQPQPMGGCQKCGQPARANAPAGGAGGGGGTVADGSGLSNQIDQITGERLTRKQALQQDLAKQQQELLKGASGGAGGGGGGGGGRSGGGGGMGGGGGGGGMGGGSGSSSSGSSFANNAQFQLPKDFGQAPALDKNVAAALKQAEAQDPILKEAEEQLKALTEAKKSIEEPKAEVAKPEIPDFSALLLQTLAMIESMKNSPQRKLLQNAPSPQRRIVGRPLNIVPRGLASGTASAGLGDIRALVGNSAVRSSAATGEVPRRSMTGRSLTAPRNQSAHSAR